MENSIVGPSLPLRRGIISNLRAKIQGLANSSNGAAAVEFAFVVPIMLTLYFGAMELSQGIEVNKKAGRASSLVGDLVSQQAVITKGEIIAIADIAAATIQPYNRSKAKVEVVGIQISDEASPKARVVWSQRVTKGVGTSFLTVGNLITIPSELMIRNTFVVRGGLSVEYMPVTAYTIQTSISNGKKGIMMGEEYYLRPRTSPTIVCTGC